MFAHRDHLWITGPDDTVGGLQSIEQCDRAIAALTEVVANIEGRLADPNSDLEWRRRAKRALSLRKAARAEIYSRRKDFKMAAWKTSESRLLAVLKSMDPALFYRAVNAVNGLEEAA